MGSEKIARRLRELVAFHSGAVETSLSAESTPQNTQGWDSAANLGFIAAIEEEFGVTFSTREVMKLRSLGDFTEYLATHASAAAAALE